MAHFGTRTAGVLFATVVLAAGATPARADFIHNDSGLTNPATTITFGNATYPPNTPLTTQYSGVIFEGLYYDSGYNDGLGGPYNYFPHFSDSYAGTFTDASNPNSSFTILFTTTQTSAAFALAAFGVGDTTFDVYLGTQLIASETVTTNESSQDNFYGFSNISGGFDSIRVTPGIDVIADGAVRPAVIDNIQLGDAGSPVNATPAPPGLVLMATGFFGLIGFRYRSRKTQTTAVA